MTLPSAPPVRPPLGLPTGSVRALLAFLLSGTLWYLILNERTIPPILAESALLVVAFYFGVRSTTPVVSTAAEAQRERQPLFLPRGAIRALLMIGFLGVIGFTYLSGRALSSTLILILQVLVSYLVGFVVGRFMLRRIRAGTPMSRPLAAVRNLVSLLVLGIAGFVCGAILYDRFDLVPDVAQNALAWTVAFYFGSRLAD